MKLAKTVLNWVLTILVVIIFLGIITIGLAFMPNRLPDASMSEHLNGEMLATDLLENILNDMEADSQTISAVFEAKDIAPIVNGGLKKAFENDENVKINYAYVTFEDSHLVFTMHADINTPVMSFPTKIVASANFAYDGENMVFSVKDIYVGRIPISKGLVGIFAKRFEESASVQKLGQFEAASMTMKISTGKLLESLNGLLTLVDSQITQAGWRFSFEINLPNIEGGDN